MKKSIGTVLLALCLAGALDARAAAPNDLVASGSPDDKGQAIARELGVRNVGWKDLAGDVEMVLADASGGHAERKFRIKALEHPDAASGDWLMVVFDAPADVKGTAVLSHARVDGDDEQWLYLPSSHRTKRVSSSNKSGSFAGSEFSFEDLAAGDPRRYAWKFTGTSVCGGGECFVVEATPKDPASSYSKRVLSIDATELRVQSVDFYDRKGQKLKTLAYDHYEKVNGKFWRARAWTMKNHQTGKSTVLTFTTLKIGSGLTTSDFATAKLGG